MAGHDYIGDGGLDAATARWLAAVAPWDRDHRPHGDPGLAGLLVLDVQRFFTDPDSHAHLPAVGHVLPRIRGLAAAFGRLGAPVLFTRHALREDDDPGRMGDWWGDVVRDGHRWGELCARAGEPGEVLRKTRYDAFAGTDLDARLRDLGVTTLVIAGVMTHLCCETTARSAFGRGYHVLVAADATASAAEELHVGALRSLCHGFARVQTADWIEAWRRGAERPAAADPGPAALADDPERLLDVLIVGGGPAGLAAATQAARQGLTVAVIERAHPGGLLRQADLVENHLGAGPISGAALAARIAAQAGAAGVRIRRGEVRRIELRPDGYRVELDRGPLCSRALVLATGTRPRSAGIEGEAALLGHRVHHGVRELLVATPGPGHAAVVGGGDAAFDQAVSLRRRGWRVTVLMRGDAARALPLLQRRASGLGVQLWPGAVVERLDDTPQGIDIVWRRGENSGTLPADQVLVAVGRVPSAPAMVDCRGGADCELAADDWAGLPRFEAIGDLVHGRHRQVAIATGDGVAAAMRLAGELAGEQR